MCKAIVRNIGYLLSYDFWRLALRDKEFPVITIVLLILFAGCSDILRMIFTPGYPEKAAD
jgi:hypothetical protein